MSLNFIVIGIVILMHSIEYDLFSMTLILVSFECIGIRLHDTVYNQSMYMYDYCLVVIAIHDGGVAWYYSVYQVSTSVAIVMNFLFFCFDFIFSYDREFPSSLVMVICRWLLYVILIFLKVIADEVISIDTKIVDVIFYCFNCHGIKFCFAFGKLTELQVGTILISRFLSIVFEYG